MRLNYWLRSLFEVPPRRRTRTAAAAVEVLEDRTLLTTFTVNTTDDTIDTNPGDGIAADSNGTTSLRAAVMEANALVGDDTINLPAGTYSFTITGTQEDAAAQGDLDVTETDATLTIIGDGASEAIIHANYVDRVFDVNYGATLDLSGITISGGSVTIDGKNGGGIRNVNALTLTDSILSDNSAVKGGGIYNIGHLQMVRVTVADNLSRFGGGVFSGGSDLG